VIPTGWRGPFPESLYIFAVVIFVMSVMAIVVGLVLLIV
jgi:hypothetical protein